MNFERSGDPKKTIGIGPENTAIDVYAIAANTIVNTYEKTFFARKTLSESNAIRVLLGIKEGELSMKDYFVHLGPKRRRRRTNYISIKEYMGKWIRFKGHIYYIPYE